MKRLGVLLVLALLVVACSPSSGDDGGGDGDSENSAGGRQAPRLNHLQVLSTHNSYHVEPEPVLLDALRGAIGDEADGLQYSHGPLDEQFDLGVRHVELDVFVDSPEGGRYASPRLVDSLGLESVDPAMTEPGLKVFHIQEVDFRSSCPLLTTCLETVRDWSEAHPDHLPIVIQIETKDDPVADPGLGFVQPLPWDEAAFATLEDEISAVFDRDQLITPADVQGDAATLREAVTGDGWPRIDDVRGRVMLTLDDGGEERELYRSLRPDPRDRLVFVAAEPPDDDAAMVVVNEPIEDEARIRDLVDQGFLVRTRADADTVEARSGDTTRREAAWASGAHFVSTDYEVADERFGDYVVEVPGDGVARCNPVTAPRRCHPRQMRE